MENEHDIFISYSDKDRELASKVYDALVAEGFNCWISFNDIHHGEVWAKAITQGIKNSKTFLLILTPNSNSSDQVLREIEYADKQKKKLYCYKVGNIVTSDALDYFISSIQQFETHKLSFAKGIERMSKELKRFLGVQQRPSFTPPIQKVISDDNTEKLILISKWIISVLCIIAFFNMTFFQSLVWAGIGYLSMGILLLPPLKSFFIAKIPFLRNRIYKALILVVLLILTGLALEHKDEETYSVDESLAVDTTVAVDTSAFVDTAAANPGDYSTWTIAQLEAKAPEGDAAVQVWLGKKYFDIKDYTNAMKWYLESAKNGEAVAKFNIGNLYFTGTGVEKDYTKALEWYLEADKQGNASAQSDIGYMYHEGLGVTQDYRRALQWYQKAAEGGNASAQFNIGYVYYNGQGVSKDTEIAKEWFLKAAKQGDITAKEWLKDKYSITDY
jgi:hypothetical protein